jgi:hypothetical protein
MKASSRLPPARQKVTIKDIFNVLHTSFGTRRSSSTCINQNFVVIIIIATTKIIQTVEVIRLQGLLFFAPNALLELAKVCFVFLLNKFEYLHMILWHSILSEMPFYLYDLVFFFSETCTLQAQ